MTVRKAHAGNKEADFNLADEAASTGDLTPAHKEDVFKLILRPRVFLPALLIVVFALIAFLLQNRPQSRLQIRADQDKFKIEFFIEGRDQKRAENLLSKLKLPRSILQGVEFELDSTSAAKLAFASPLVIGFEIREDNITFSGQSGIALASKNLTVPQNIKLPATTYLALYGPDFKKNLKKRLAIPEDLVFWLDQNFNSEQGMLLSMFTGDVNMALSVMSPEPLDIDALGSLAKEVGQDAHKQEAVEDTIIHLIKISDQTLAIFEAGGWAHATTSLDTAKQLLAVWQGEAPYVNFPKTPPAISYVIYFRKTDAANPESLSQIVGNRQLSSKFIENIAKALLLLDGESISGYIDF